jgi:hypothetical protein
MVIQHYMIKFVNDLRQCRWFSLCTHVSSIDITDRHENSLNIVESGVKHHNHNSKIVIVSVNNIDYPTIIDE